MKILNSKSGICIGNISGHISKVWHIGAYRRPFYLTIYHLWGDDSLTKFRDYRRVLWVEWRGGGEEGGTQEHPLKGESRDGAKQIICGCRCYCLPLGYFNMYGYIYKSRWWACVCGEELSPVLVSLLLTCLSCTNGEGLLGITSTRDLSLPPLNWVACSHRSFIYTYGFYKVFCI